ncbi:hypothetical protein PFISCL1PPCAC_14377, partial [Pristionchus fissidentatus]
FLPSPLPSHDLFTITHHSIVDSLAIIFNFLLLLSVLFRSPSALRSYTVLLVNSVVIDIIGSFTMLITMIRLIPAEHVLAYIYDGPCVHISSFFCHAAYTVMLATFSQSLFLIASSFAYRLYVLGRPSPQIRSVLALCLIISVPNILVLTTFMFTLDDSDLVRADLKAIRPDYELDEYLVQGHLTIFSMLVMFTILAMTMPIGPTMVVIFIIRRKVLAKIKAQSVTMSEKTSSMHSTLTKVLTLQSLLPVFFSGAVLSYGLCQLDITCSPVQEHFIMESLSFIPLVSPLITIFCMKPYRELLFHLTISSLSSITPSSILSPSSSMYCYSSPLFFGLPVVFGCS